MTSMRALSDVHNQHCLITAVVTKQLMNVN